MVTKMSSTQYSSGSPTVLLDHNRTTRPQAGIEKNHADCLHAHRPSEILEPMNHTLQPGDIAPDFHTIAVGGSHGEAQSISLSSLRGKIVILYFYPKDDTPGCTTQACALRDNHTAILAKGALIYGVSIDSPASHAKFIAKHQLPFPLLSDESRSIVEAYGVWVEKSMYGKKYMGTERTTFVIGPDGLIRAIHRKIPPANHVPTILKDL